MEDKQAVVTEVAAQVAKAQAIVLAEYRGLEVGHMTELRRKARGSGVYLRVLKNTLARRAVEGTPFAGLSQHMKGPLVYGISPDPVATAKVLNEFARANEKLVIRAGAMPNAVISAKEVTALALMPSREELLAKLLGTMQAPIAQFARTLNEVPARFARTLAAVRDKRQAAGAQ
jgi:large subunit ribosomal protein L10